MNHVLEKWGPVSGGVSKSLYVFASIFIVIFYASGFYLCDDSNISFAVAENLFSGFGPVYTAGERVQVHSNPLWTFLMTLGRFVTVDYSKISFFFSMLFMSGILAVSWRVFERYSFLVIAYLFCSKVLFSFMGSGLENPLTYFLIFSAMAAFLRSNGSSP